MSERNIRRTRQHSKNQSIAEPNTILQGVVGSTVHGLALEGTDDEDQMGVCIEPPEYVIGNASFEQWIYRSAEERDKHERYTDQRKGGKTPKSEAGDLDLVVYSLRKWARLAAAGNPTVLMLLYLPEYKILTDEGRALIAVRDLFSSRQAGHRFLGYLKAQKERLLGERGQMRVTRTELIEKYGYDTKFAMHALRLGYQGVEFLFTGQLTLPMYKPHRIECMRVRRGEVSLNDVVARIEALEVLLKTGIEDSSPLPEHPDYEAIDRVLIQLYEQHWSKNEKG